MGSDFSLMKEMAMHFSRNCVSLLLLGMTILYIILRERKKWYPQVLLLVMLLGITAVPMWSSVLESLTLRIEVYQGVFLLFPTLPMMALIIADLACEKRKENTKVYRKGIFALLCACLLLCTAAKFKFAGQSTEPAYLCDNEYEKEVRLIHDTIVSSDYTRVIATDSIASELRESDTQISVVYGPMYDLKEDATMEEMIAEANLYGCVGIVAENTEENKAYMEEQEEYRLLLETKNYRTYVR